MSSILDALRKVEEEREAAAGNADVNLDEAVAEQELYGDRDTEFRVTPAVLAIGGICFTVAVVAVSVVIAIMMVNQTPPATTQTVAAAPIVQTPAAALEVPQEPQPEIISDPSPAEPAATEAPELEPTTVAVAVSPEPKPQPVASETFVEEPAPTPPPRQTTAQPAPTMKEEPIVVAKVTPKPTPPPAQPRQTVIPSETASQLRPAPTTQPRAWQPPPTPQAESGDEDGLGDIALLPRLSSAVKSRYRLDDKRLMMPRPDSKPRQSALIDRVEVYVGERIGGSNATLIGVDGRGVAIEIMGTGERYYWRMGS